MSSRRLLDLDLCSVDKELYIYDVFFSLSFLAILNSVCSLVTVDWPAVNLFEIAVKSIRVAVIPRLL